jgi:hypothetical protein
MKRGIYLVALVVSFHQCLDASDTVNQQEAIVRLEQAVAKTNIFELPSFAMKADLRLLGHGKEITGTYQLLWNGAERWRESISVPGYSEVEIGEKGKIWLQRSSDFIPFAIYNLHQALGFGSSADAPRAVSLVQLPITSKDTIKKITAKKVHGDRVTCFEIEDEQKYPSQLCVRDEGGTIDRTSSSEKDDNLQPAGGKVFPRHLSCHTRATMVFGNAQAFTANATLVHCVLHPATVNLSSFHRDRISLSAIAAPGPHIE